MEYPKFKVSVSCMTYNQSKYITDAMNGFTMQQTSFPFVCTIVDDASTDGEQEVIRKYVEENFDFSEGSVAYQKETDYAHITYAQHKTNKNCYFAVLYLKENHYSKRKDKRPYLKEWRDGVEYMALCEGDDYWIAADKLQKQVSFLDQNAEYSMCFHKAKVLVESSAYSYDEIHVFDCLEEREYFGKEFVKKWMIPTASMLYRQNIVAPEDSRFYVGDVKLSIQCASEGRVYCFADEMSVYRRTAQCATIDNRNVNLFKLFNQELAYIEHFPIFRKEFENRLIMRIGLLFYSPNILNVLKQISINHTLSPFFFKALFRAFPKRIALTLRKIFNK